MQSGRSKRIHLGVECAQKGKLSYILCRGFPSIGKHIEVPDEIEGAHCAQCAKILDRMKRSKNHNFVMKSL